MRKRYAMFDSLTESDFKRGADYASFDPTHIGEVPASIYGAISPADPSVGIFSAGVEDISIETQDGTDVTDLLTDDAIDRLACRSADYVYDCEMSAYEDEMEARAEARLEEETNNG